jgi:hypothetical protein
MHVDWAAIIGWVVQTIAASGVAILGFIGLRATAIGERLLGHHFDRKIAELKHAYDQKIEALKADLSHLGDRGRRANEREYDAVTEIWNAFVDAFLKTNQAIVSFLSFPDLNHLAPEELTAFLETTELSLEQRRQVSAAADKIKMYSNVMSLRQINSAGASIFDARLLLRTRGIFVQKNMVDDFKSALDDLSKVQTERYVEFQHKIRVGSPESMRQLKEGEATFDRLQSNVRTRLIRDEGGLE